jgi:uncharacterized protein YegL
MLRIGLVIHASQLHEGVTMSEEHLEQVEFADNPEPRCPVVLVLDVSGSMAGKPIAELNQGLQDFAQTLKSDPLAALRVEVALIAFGGKVRALDVRNGSQDEIPIDADKAFVTIDAFQPPVLAASGETPMGEALRRTLTLVRERKEIYKRNGADYFRPWVFLITDGQPNDAGWEAVPDLVKEEERRKGLLFYAVGVENADMKTLARFGEDRPPMRLRGLAFRELFQWLSKSLSAVAQSRPGEQVALPAVGWGQVDTAAQ